MFAFAYGSDDGAEVEFSALEWRITNPPPSISLLKNLTVNVITWKGEASVTLSGGVTADEEKLYFADVHHCFFLSIILEIGM